MSLFEQQMVLLFTITLPAKIKQAASKEKTSLGLGPVPPNLTSTKLFVKHSIKILCQASQTVGLIASHWTSFQVQLLFNTETHLEN